MTLTSEMRGRACRHADKSNVAANKAGTHANTSMRIYTQGRVPRWRIIGWRARDGFNEFVTARTVRLMRTARLLTRDWAAAEDLVQEALAKAWFVWPRLRDDPEAYVRRTIVTTYISQSRRRWRKELPTDELPESPATNPYDHSDRRVVMWRALGRLPVRQRAVIVLRYYEDFTDAQIAETMHTSVGTVKSQAAKALAKLRADDAIADPVAEMRGVS